jgi:hypothetical protein
MPLDAHSLSILPADPDGSLKTIGVCQAASVKPSLSSFLPLSNLSKSNPDQLGPVVQCLKTIGLDWSIGPTGQDQWTDHDWSNWTGPTVPNSE